MNDAEEEFDNFSQAIVEFREEILLWIDGALVRLREREQDESVAKEERSAPANLTRCAVEGGSRTHSPIRSIVGGRGEAELQPAMRWNESRNNEEIRRRDSLDDSERRPVVSPRPEPDPKSKSAPLDSFKRLDALARLLDERLKLSEGADSITSMASGEVGESNG